MYETNTNQELSPELIQAILALQAQDTEKKRIARQQQQAQALRAQGQQGMGATSPGGGRVGAPNWAGTLANIYAAKKASDMDAAGNAQSDKMDADRQAALRQYFEALRSQQRTQDRSGMSPAPESLRGSYMDDGIA